MCVRVLFVCIYLFYNNRFNYIHFHVTLWNIATKHFDCRWLNLLNANFEYSLTHLLIHCRLLLDIIWPASCIHFDFHLPYLQLAFHCFFCLADFSPYWVFFRSSAFSFVAIILVISSFLCSSSIRSSCFVLAGGLLSIGFLSKFVVSRLLSSYLSLPPPSGAPNRSRIFLLCLILHMSHSFAGTHISLTILIINITKWVGCVLNLSSL